MMNSQQDRGGIVKSLLYPSYADAGASDTFNNNNIDATSEASTQVAHNLSSSPLRRKSPPGFFNSTKPRSPPKLSRVPINERSDSTTVVINNNNEEPQEATTETTNLPHRQKKNTNPSSFSSHRLPPSSPGERSLLDESEEEDESETNTATPSEVEQLNKTLQSEDNRNEDSKWEEEATPSQTAFAKQVITESQRQIQEQKIKHAKDNSSDIMSTASEMGTVINYERLQDLDDMVGTKTPILEDERKDEYSRPVWDEVEDSNHEDEEGDDALALPILTAQQSKTKHSVDFSSMLRRIGSNMNRNGPLSAPTTPKRYLSANQKEHSDGGPPATFLLRSPGSEAYSSARNALTPQDSRALYHRNPFQIAKACFSFDDTTMDDKYDLPVQPSLSLPHYRPSFQDIPAKGRASVPVRPQFSSLQGGQLSSQILQPPIRNASWDTHLMATSEEQHLPIRNVKSFMDSPRRGQNFDYSPSRAVELESPQRVHMEREDALDILALIARRGATLDPTGKTPSKSRRNTDDILERIKELREISKVQDGAVGLEEDSHRERMEALDELIRSYDYANEMKRVSKTATSWLRSIGRESIDKNTLERFITDLSVEPNLSTDATAGATTLSDSVDLATAMAKLHSTEMELQEKKIQTRLLNEELAKCRAEIGRLNSAAQGAKLKPMNRSILDDDEAEEDDIAGDIVENSDQNEASFLSQESNILSASFVNPFSSPLVAEEKSELSKFREALEEANNMIKKLHAELQSEKDDGVIHDPPVVLVDETTRSRPSPGSSDDKMINVRMLDEENFVTEWNDLSPPLPPPSDHDLRSPIVDAVLDHWTDDPDLKESLLSWIEQVTDGNDVASIPPLALSNLDHQARDGFIIHVLPTLLRRSDIRVDVKTRALRTTTYDLAVTVDSLVQKGGAGHFDFRRHLESTTAQSDVGAASVAHSASTALMGNIGQVDTSRLGAGKQGRLSYDEVADDLTANQQASLMSTIGGALGGLLRKKALASPQDAASSMANDLNSNEEEDEQEPYHRVVSAPPGRIGVTFVEYRGHAMVSDVKADSPLSGWIFVSDILIAIDELPVSGMRVRDIIKVLKDRGERQRALRVISSHAMNEFTLNTSVLGE